MESMTSDISARGPILATMSVTGYVTGYGSGNGTGYRKNQNRLEEQT
jgi:hypothetical protein